MTSKANTGDRLCGRHYALNFVALVIAFVVFAPLINSVGVIVLQSIRMLGISKQQAGVVKPFVDVPMAFSSLVIGSVLPTLGVVAIIVSALPLARHLSLGSVRSLIELPPAAFPFSRDRLRNSFSSTWIGRILLSVGTDRVLMARLGLFRQGGSEIHFHGARA